MLHLAKLSNCHVEFSSSFIVLYDSNKNITLDNNIYNLLTKIFNLI